MPPRKRVNGNTKSPDTAKAPRPRLTDEQKAIKAYDTAAKKVKGIDEKLKKARATAAELDEQRKREQRFLDWAKANPFLPESYGEQADVAAGDAKPIPAPEEEQPTGGDDTTAVADSAAGPVPTLADGSDLPGADQLGDAEADAAELTAERAAGAPAEAPSAPAAVAEDDPFAAYGGR